MSWDLALNTAVSFVTIPTGNLSR
ncbi:hypothetical protein ACLK17_03845 [Escherichia coli]